MFCSGCGKEIPEGSKFCPGCGKATDGTPNVTNAVSDSTKILKEGEFRRYEKAMEALSKKNDGKLTLFCDRVEWRGRVNEDIKITDIVKVVAGSKGLDPYIEITDSAGKIRSYFRPRSFTQAWVPALSQTAGAFAISGVNTSSNLAEMESWRAAIDKLRGRL